MATDYIADSGASASAPPPKLQQSHEGEHHGDFGGTEVPVSRNVKLFAFCASINSVNLGFVVGISTSAGRMIQAQFGLSDEQFEIFIGALNFFSIFGALSSNFFSDRYGRRFTFKLAAIGFVVGLLIQVFGMNYASIMVGRALVGLGVGIGLAVSPVVFLRWVNELWLRAATASCEYTIDFIGAVHCMEVHGESCI